MENTVKSRAERVIDAMGRRNGKLNPAMTFIISGREVQLLRELKMRYHELPYWTAIRHGEMLRRIIDAVFRNIVIEFPVVVYRRTYDLYTAPQGDWYKVLVDKALRDQIMSL